MKQQITILVGAITCTLERVAGVEGAQGYVADMSPVLAIAATYYPARGVWRVAIFAVQPTGAHVVAHETARTPQEAVHALPPAAVEAVELQRAA
jgi:hypothetical protein